LARGHAIGAIGDGVGHVDDIDDSSAVDGAVAITYRLLHGDGLILIESKGEMVGVVAAGDGDGLGLDLGVEVFELARMTLNGAGVGGDLGGVLVLHDAQFERVLLAQVGAGDGLVIIIIKGCVIIIVHGGGLVFVFGSVVVPVLFIVKYCLV
jgi:hypothetical protein